MTNILWLSNMLKAEHKINNESLAAFHVTYLLITKGNN